MSDKTFIEDEANAPASQIGATIEALCATIEKRADAPDDGSSWTKTLLAGPLDKLLKKVSEESLEVALAAKECQMLKACSDDDAAYDASVDHMRYEAADVIYHLLVLMQRFDVPLDELAAEPNMRMCADELPQGAVMLKPEHVRRGK